MATTFQRCCHLESPLQACIRNLDQVCISHANLITARKEAASQTDIRGRVPAGSGGQGAVSPALSGSELLQALLLLQGLGHKGRVSSRF